MPAAMPSMQYYLQQQARSNPYPVGNIATWGKGAQGGSQPAPQNDAPYQPESTYDPYAAAQSRAAAAQAAEDGYVRDQYQSQLNRLDPQLNVGLDNLNRSYQQNLGQLDYSKQIAERDYGLGKEDTERGYQTTRNNVATQTRNRMNALQRLLGIAGAGNSSAATEAAPYAALREGTVNLQGAQQSYATNRRKQDINWNDTLTDYSNKRSQADDDRANKENSLRASIAQTRAGILDQLSRVGGQNRAAYQGQINGLLDQITNLGRQSINTIAPTAYKAPELQQYNLNARTPNVQIAPQQASVADSINPSLLPLLARKEDEFGQLV